MDPMYWARYAGSFIIGLYGGLLIEPLGFITSALITLLILIAWNILCIWVIEGPENVKE